MGRISFTKAQRAQAKAEKKCLVAIAVDSQYSDEIAGGFVSLDGPMRDELAKKVKALLFELITGIPSKDEPVHNFMKCSDSDCKIPGCARDKAESNCR